MKKTFKYLSIVAIGLLTFSISSCEEDDEDPVIETRIVEKEVQSYQATFRMAQKVNGVDVELNTSNMPYQNAAGNNFMISRLRYLISDVALHKEDGSCFTIDDYHFVNVADTSTLVYEPSIQVP